MIVVIADDFSGAAELAGIAAAHGFKAEVQTRFDPASDAEVIAVDTDTRLRTESDAAGIVGEAAREILAAGPEWIYKKTDSVLRGHVRAEIESILDAAGQRGCLLIPANPSKGRTIENGRYSIDGVPLNETVFAHDPDYPRHTDLVRELLGESSRIRMPDVTTMTDLIPPMDASTLAAGASDLFESCLNSSGGAHRGITTGLEKQAMPILLLCGSLAAWDSGRADEMKRRGFVVQTLDQPVPPSIWQQTQKLMLAIGRPQSGDTATLTKTLIEAAHPFIAASKNLRIGLEGGATAMALIRRMGWTRFEVLPEGYTGVGTLRSAGGQILCVKPGSYPWPQGCFECQD